MLTLNANALATRSEVKDFMGTKAAGDIDDVIINIINRVSSMFESFCNREFFTSSHTEYYDGGGSWLFPKNSPITAITSINQDSNWDWDAETLIDSAEYRIADENSVFFNSSFSSGPQSVELVYVAGFTSDNLPEDLKQACIIEVVRIYKHRDNPDVLTVNREDGTVSFVTYNFLPQTLRTLSHFKKVYAL